MREAQALKTAGRLDEAVRLYGEAVAADPRSAVAEHNLAAALGDAGRWTEADGHVSAAFAKGLDAPETWLVKARCDQGLGRIEAADQSFREALKRRPTMYDALRDLAQLIWMTTGDQGAALTDIDAAIRRTPGDPNLQLVKTQALEFSGQADKALSLMTELAQTNPNIAPFHLRAAELANFFDKGAEALRHAERALALTPDDLPARLALVASLLAIGDAKNASDAAGDIRRRWSMNQLGIALQATAWRMLGDPRYRQLYDYESLVGVETLDTPEGWSSLEAYIADVAAALKQVHAFREHPFGQSLRHGGQAPWIQYLPYPALQALPRAIDGPIRRRLAALGYGDDPVRARNRNDYALQGMWSVQLHPGGYHVDHVHQEGWLSSACYIETVPSVGREGWIRFGQPGVKTHPSLEAEHYIEPRPGMLVLFPSYMWHGTVPFSGDRRRLTFAFDLVPGPAPLGDDD